jgi:hypothetical protein
LIVHIVVASTIAAQTVLIPWRRRWLIVLGLLLGLLLSVVHVCHCVVHNFAVGVKSYADAVDGDRMLRDGATPVDTMARGSWRRRDSTIPTVGA